MQSSPRFSNRRPWSHQFKLFQSLQYEFIDVKKSSTVDYTCDGMSMDVNKVFYAAVRPHQETVMINRVKDDQDPSVTSSSSASQQVCSQ